MIGTITNTLKIVLLKWASVRKGYSNTINSFVHWIQISVSFRHTKDLESFNSMILKYSPKRISFEYQYYHDRMYSPAIDHNIHLFERQRYQRKVRFCMLGNTVKSKEKCHAQPLKEIKKYSHIRRVLASTINRRITVGRCNTTANDQTFILPKIRGKTSKTLTLIKKHVWRM